MPRKRQQTESAGIDRRQETRHAVKRPCSVAPDSPPAEALSGTTTNVSRSGMLVRFPALTKPGVLPKVGDQARVVIELPPSANYAPRTLECNARVIRSEESEDHTPALAFEVLRMVIRERDDKAGCDSSGAAPLVQ